MLLLGSCVTLLLNGGLITVDNGLMKVDNGFITVDDGYVMVDNRLITVGNGLMKVGKLVAVSLSDSLGICSSIICCIVFFFV